MEKMQVLQNLATLEPTGPRRVDILPPVRKKMARKNKKCRGCGKPISKGQLCIVVLGFLEGTSDKVLVTQFCDDPCLQLLISGEDYKAIATQNKKRATQVKVETAPLRAQAKKAKRKAELPPFYFCIRCGHLMERAGREKFQAVLCDTCKGKKTPLSRYCRICGLNFGAQGNMDRLCPICRKKRVGDYPYMV